MNKKKIITKNQKQTLNLGKNFAQKLKGGEVVALYGQLGTGKTTFIKGIGQGLKVRQTITSPSFILMKIYPIRKKRIKYLIHLDAYRIKKVEELSDLNVFDYFNQPDSVCLIEWADRIEKILPKERINIYFDYGKKENERIIIFQ